MLVDFGSSGADDAPEITEKLLAMEALLGNLTSMLSNLTFVPACSRQKDFHVVERTFYGVLLPFVCMLGVLCNILVFVTLQSSRTRFKSSSHVFFRFLSIFNAICLLSYFIDYVDAVFIKDNLTSSILIAYIDWPASSYAATMSLVFVVCSVVDRFCYLYKPVFQATAMKDRVYLARFIAVNLCLFVGALNSPRMFAYTVDFKTGCKHTRWTLEDGTSGWFLVYSYLRLVIYNGGCVAALLIFYGLLIDRLKRLNKWHIQYALAALCDRKMKLKRRQEKSLTLTLLVSVFVTLIGEITSLLLNPLTAVKLWNVDTNSDRFLEMRRVGKVLMIIEYSGNFFVYFFFYKNFRIAFQNILKRLPCYHPTPRSIHHSDSLGSFRLKDRRPMLSDEDDYDDEGDEGQSDDELSVICDISASTSTTAGLINVRRPWSNSKRRSLAKKRRSTVISMRRNNTSF